MISTSLIVTMWVVAAVLTVIAIAVPLLVDGHVEFTISAFFLGIIMYAAFDTILLDLFDTVLLANMSPQVHDYIYSNDILYVVYYTFIHSFFYVIGFYTVARMGFRVDKGGTGVAIGLGAGGARMVMSGAWPLVMRAVSAYRVNKMGVEAYLADATEGEIDNLRAAIDSMRTSVPSDVIWSGVETILMFAAIIAIATVIHLGVTHRAPIWFVGIGWLLLVAMFVPAALYTIGIIDSVPFLELCIFAVAAASSAFAVPVARRYMDNPLKF